MLLLSRVLVKKAFSVCFLLWCLFTLTFTLILKLLSNIRFHALSSSMFAGCVFLCSVIVWLCDVTSTILLNVKEENSFKILQNSDELDHPS